MKTEGESRMGMSMRHTLERHLNPGCVGYPIVITQVLFPTSLEVQLISRHQFTSASSENEFQLVFFSSAFAELPFVSGVACSTHIM
jgi:hypothetical protein